MPPTKKEDVLVFRLCSYRIERNKDERKQRILKDQKPIPVPFHNAKA
jgi:hypothetical protein